MTSVVVLVMLTVFFVTSADSASIVMGSLAQRGRTEPTRRVIIALGLMLSAIAVVMLLIGGESALESMQDLIIVSALPFAIAIVLTLACTFTSFPELFAGLVVVALLVTELRQVARTSAQSVPAAGS